MRITAAAVLRIKAMLRAREMKVSVVFPPPPFKYKAYADE